MTAYADTISRPARTLTESEQRLLLKVTGQHVDGFRDHCIYSLAMGTGLREHEILALDVGDVFDDAGRAKRRVALRVFKRSAKDPAPQEVLLPDVVRAKLEKLLAARKRAGEAITPATPIFVSRLGRRLSARQLRHAFSVWQKRAGFERHLSFHSTRHTACTSVYRASKDLRLTQKFARHKSVVTTSIYTHPTDDELLRAVQGLVC
ncbi:site-specific integrase [Myxococcus stipitatus]|uniref:tyrosine-type recombinase/integrase n=1 Tax=Myxococcus stipitatus TaxID=83455 RepID=UPI003144DB20